jgi:hypothetical protein
MYNASDRNYHEVVLELCPQRFSQIVVIAENDDSDVLTILHKAINAYAAAHYLPPPPEENL